MRGRLRQPVVHVAALTADATGFPCLSGPLPHPETHEHPQNDTQGRKASSRGAERQETLACPTSPSMPVLLGSSTGRQRDSEIASAAMSPERKP